MKSSPAPVLLLLIVALFGSEGCKRKVTQAQCDQLIDHFAELIAREKLEASDGGLAADAGEALAAEHARALQVAKKVEREEAMHVDELKNCTSEVQASEFDCAMKATGSDAMLKCLE